MNIFQVIEQETAGLRQRTAVVDGTFLITYAELLDGASQVAELLRQQGVAQYHRVGLLCEDSIDYVIASLAILSLSAAIVPISPDQSRDEIEAVIHKIDLDFLVAEERLRSGGTAVPFRSGAFRSRLFTILERQSGGVPDDEYYRLNPAFIRFSSGTTGASKGVVMSHEAIVERTDAADRGLAITSGDTVLWVLSMSFHFVVTILLFLRRGATMVLCGKNLPHALIDGINNHCGTFIYASPFHYSLLAGSADVAGDALKNIRMAVSTAMKLPEQTAADFAAKFHMELTEAYGIIEVGLPFIRLSGNSGKRGSVGPALPDFQLRIDNPDADGIGDILIKGKGMLDAYYSPWQGRKAILRDGWFATGDLGRLDEDGFLFIVGRSKDVINFIGMKIFAQEVEVVLNSHPSVRESRVFGVPHPSYGELPAARIILNDGAIEEEMATELQRFCYRHLTSYKVPKEFEFVPELPRTASGKLKR